jgi:hypothetical protein
MVQNVDLAQVQRGPESGFKPLFLNDFFIFWLDSPSLRQNSKALDYQGLFYFLPSSTSSHPRPASGLPRWRCRRARFFL